jgi:hypothetical protein
MSRDHWMGFMILLVLFVVGTVVFWFIGLQDVFPPERAMAYLFFLTFLAGFSVLSYYLLSLKPLMPALQVDVLPASDTPGMYKNEKTSRLVFSPDPDGTVLRVRCALRIINTGTRPATKVFFVFFFRRRSKSSGENVGRLVVDYNREKQRHAKSLQSDVDVRDGYPVGYTLHLDDAFTVYPDVNDKRIAAELELVFKSEHFEEDFELRYRIHSYEGNQYVSDRANEQIGEATDQSYRIRFERSDKKKV